jgi:hypothetical protein
MCGLPENVTAIPVVTGEADTKITHGEVQVPRNFTATSPRVPVSGKRLLRRRGTRHEALEAMLRVGVEGIGCPCLGLLGPLGLKLYVGYPVPGLMMMAWMVFRLAAPCPLPSRGTA